MYKRTHQKAVLVDSNSSLSSVESHGIASMERKKSTANHQLYQLYVSGPFCMNIGAAMSREAM